MVNVRMIPAHTIPFVANTKNRYTALFMKVKCPSCKRTDAEFCSNKQLKSVGDIWEISDHYRCKCGRIFLARDGIV